MCSILFFLFAWQHCIVCRLILPSSFQSCFNLIVRNKILKGSAFQIFPSIFNSSSSHSKIHLRDYNHQRFAGAPQWNAPVRYTNSLPTAAGHHIRSYARRGRRRVVLRSSLVGWSCNEMNRFIFHRPGRSGESYILHPWQLAWSDLTPEFDQRISFVTDIIHSDPMILE